jgi:cellulose synthase/poly-beta-1,6-N-acetylglucosamine synthase-like glycosyltransferase
MMRISVIIITRNVEEFMTDCLDSLVSQSRKPDELIIVDAESTDATHAIVNKYAKEHHFIKMYVKALQKGESRNFGVSMASGDIVAFLDADTIVNSLWVEEMLKAFGDQKVHAVAGKEVRMGYHGFAGLKRVPLVHKGYDVTYPTVNMAYRREVFDAVQGFDPWFKEAEDVDMNFRVVDADFHLIYWEKAIVYHRVRSSFGQFFKQAFWYGFGRKELTLRHGQLWHKYDPMEMVKVSRDESIWKILRLVISSFGYMFCLVVGKKQKAKERLRRSKASER